jgi:PAS domain S-box-containing protein
MPRLFRMLREKGILTPARLVLLFLVILTFIIILSQFFHQTLQNEMADQFNRQQLLLAQQVAINIDGFINHVFKDISVISRLPGVDRISRSDEARSVVESIHYHLESDIVMTLRVLDSRGVIIYDSASKEDEGRSLADTDYFQAARTLRLNERLVTDLLPPPRGRTNPQRIVLAVPILRRGPGGELPVFQGVVLAVLSMDGITQKFLAPVKSGTRGYAWMMDKAGTLLYHPTMPQMVGKNLFHTDQSCFQCHRSFEAEKKMLRSTEETFGVYEAPGGENKLAAFYRVPVGAGANPWIVVVSAPYSDVIALMHRSRSFYSTLIISIVVTTLGASIIMFITSKKRIMAEEKALHLENQRRLEQEVVIAKNYLENIIENTKTNLLVLDEALTVTTVNSAQAKTLGRTKEDILGRPFFSLFPNELPSYDGIPIGSLLRKTVESGNSFEIKEYCITGLQPEPVYLDMIVSPLNIEGIVTGIVITSTNVTKRVRLEEALKKYTSELEDRVEREVAEHRKLEQQVLHSEKLAALGRLAAGVAHEIGNPLTSISTFAQLLREMATDEFSQSSLDIINNHIRRITEIVRQMSAFSRPGAADIRPHQINEILRSSLDLMRFDKRMKSSIEIVTELDPDIPKTLIDEGQIAQVFINIILNALDAMPEGGTLTVRSRRGLDPDGRDFLSISFSDTGVGIGEGDFARIFDPFYTTKEAGKGTGLGLSVSYNIVKRFRGDIRVESTPGKGTTFTITLPIQTELRKELQNAEDEHPRR